MQPNKSRKPAPAKTPDPFTPAQLLQFFLQVLPSHALLELPALKKLTFYDRLFTPVITLWYLLFQWLNSDHTLDAAVVDAKKGGARRPVHPPVVGKSAGLPSCGSAKLKGCNEI